MQVDIYLLTTVGIICGTAVVGMLCIVILSLVRRLYSLSKKNQDLTELNHDLVTMYTAKTQVLVKQLEAMVEAIKTKYNIV